MDIKNKHVAVALDEDGKCEFVAKVKVINDREYNRLVNEKEQKKAQREKEELELKNNVLCNQEKIRKLERRDLLLAKSIYDNFVDRGLIENDDAFQQAWYDYFINDAELKFELYPAEFSKILDKVRGW